MEYNEFVNNLLAESEDLKISGDHPRAIELLQKLIMNEPNCVEAYEELGDNFLSLKKMDAAEKALREAVRVDPKSSNAHYLLGFLFSMQQKWSASVKTLRQADELNSNHPEILRCLGWSIHNANRKSQQGLALLERSQTLQPDDPNILCDLGVCYMNSDQNDRARKTFSRVLELSPTSEQARECENFLRMLDNPEKFPTSGK